MRKITLIVALFVITVFAYSQNDFIKPDEAIKHIGENGTVCGKVINTICDDFTKSKPAHRE